MVIKISGDKNDDKSDNRSDTLSRSIAGNYLVQSNQGRQQEINFERFSVGGLKLKDTENNNKFKGSIVGSEID